MKKVISALLALAMMLAMVGGAVAEGETGADVKGTGVELTIYTNSGDSGRAEWLQERAAQDGYNLVILYEGAGAVQQRLIGEAANPICDVVFGLNAIIWNDLINKDILISYDAPSWASEVSEGLNDPNGYYYAIVKQAILLAYDTAQISEEDAPKDWPDLWEREELWGKYRVEAALTGGTTRNVIAGILCRYLDENGDLGVSDEGWAAIEAFFQHGTPGESGVQNYAEWVDPNKPIIMSQMWSSGVGQYDAEYGTTTGVARPEVGVPYAVEGVGLVNGVQNNEEKYAEALRFVEWFGSAQIQGEWADRFDTMPANEKAASHASEKQQDLCSIPAQDIDWAVVATYIDDWCEKITLEYMQ